MIELLKAALMGIIEGITEWLPISSTGHMILAEELIVFNLSDAFLEMFRVVIQLGAIGAVVVIFWNKLWPFQMQDGKFALKIPSWKLWCKVLVATLPAMVIGLLFDDWIDAHFYNYITVAVMLILYGILFIVVENLPLHAKVSKISKITYTQALIVGLWQVLAIIPGTSRSGATIVGGLLLGLSRACVAEFTFFLAVPVMVGASLLKVVKLLLDGYVISLLEVGVLFTGSAVAFIVSLGAIRFLMNYVKKHDFKIFGWYRIALGAIVLLVAAYHGMT